MRVWRLADGTPVGEPLRGHHGSVTAVAAGALPDGTPVIISGGDDGTVRVWRLADGTPVGEPLARQRRRGARGGGRGAAGRHPGHHQRRRATARCGCGGWLTAPRSGSRCAATQPGAGGGGRGAAGRHPGHHQRRRATARCGCGGWPTAPRSGSRCTGHSAGCGRWRPGRCRTAPRSSSAAASDGTVRVWRLADGTPLVPPLDLPESVRAVAVHGNIIVTAAGADIAVHQLALPQPMPWLLFYFAEQRPAGKRSDNGRLSGTSGRDAWRGPGRAVQPVRDSGTLSGTSVEEEGGEGTGTAQARRHPRSKASSRQSQTDCRIPAKCTYTPAGRRPPTW